jgi:hypothetical protein
MVLSFKESVTPFRGWTRREQSTSTGTQPHQALDLARHPEKAKAPRKKLRARDRPLANDFLPEEEFSRCLRAWFGTIARVLLPGHAFYMFGGNSNVGTYPPMLKEAAL